jgi:hypothetical protein
MFTISLLLYSTLLQSCIYQVTLTVTFFLLLIVTPPMLTLNSLKHLHKSDSANLNKEAAKFILSCNTLLYCVLCGLDLAECG